jgi:hypothetical protein
MDCPTFTPPTSDDTDPEAARVQIELLRRAGVAARVRLACSLSRSVVELSRRAIREANPEATEEELLTLVVELHYGPELAAAWRDRRAGR